MRPGWLYDAVQSGHLVNSRPEGDQRWPVRVLSIGHIELPDGRLVACDPYIAADAADHFITAVPSGRHEVQVVRAVVGPDHERNAAALLVTGAGAVARWTMGVTDPDAPPPAEWDGFIGYAVDSGTGCFASPAGQQAATSVLMEDAGMLEDPLSTALEQSPLQAVVAAPAPDAPDVAVFTSGWGDGMYPTWFGHAEDGTVVLVMTDFLLAADPFTEPQPPEQKRRWWQRRSG